MTWSKVSCDKTKDGIQHVCGLLLHGNTNCCPRKLRGSWRDEYVNVREKELFLGAMRCAVSLFRVVFPSNRLSYVVVLCSAVANPTLRRCQFPSCNMGASLFAPGWHDNPITAETRHDLSASQCGQRMPKDRILPT